MNVRSFFVGALLVVGVMPLAAHWSSLAGNQPVVSSPWLRPAEVQDDALDARRLAHPLPRPAADPTATVGARAALCAPLSRRHRAIHRWRARIDPAPSAPADPAAASGERLLRSVLAMHRPTAAQRSMPTASHGVASPRRATVRSPRVCERIQDRDGHDLDRCVVVVLGGAIRRRTLVVPRPSSSRPGAGHERRRLAAVMRDRRTAAAIGLIGALGVMVLANGVLSTQHHAWTTELRSAAAAFRVNMPGPRAAGHRAGRRYLARRTLAANAGRPHLLPARRAPH